MLRSKEEYHKRLFSMCPNVYIGGDKVGRDDHRLRPGIDVMDITFDLAKDRKFKGLATANSPIVG